MKHLKTYEKLLENLWLVDYCIKADSEHNYHLYPDKESAENFIITIINQEREELDPDNYTDNMFFSDINIALEWYEENFSDIEISYYQVKLNKPFEGNERLKRMKEIKKYNL